MDFSTTLPNIVNGQDKRKAVIDISQVYATNLPVRKHHRNNYYNYFSKGVSLMNSITIRGRLAKDAETKTTAKGKVVSFLLADEYRKNGEKVNVQYINCAASRNAADAAEGLKKGAFVHIKGYLKVTRTEKDGVWYHNTTLWVNQFVPRKETSPAATPAEA